MKLDDISIIVLVGTILFISVVIFISIFIVQYQRRQLYFKKEKELLQSNFQKELLKTQLETQEDTFHLIGEELHDNIGQLLSSTRMLMGIAERSLPTVPDTLRTADQTLARAIQDMRMLSKSLNKEWLNQFNLVDNLASEIHRLNIARTVNIQLFSEIKKLPMEPGSQVMLFRIIQEGVQNAIKHAQAKNIGIYIEMEELLRIRIKDDGSGINRSEPSKEGVGLLNMQHRTGLLGGTIEWRSIQNNGTEVIIIIPIQLISNEN
jgi:signal transduction histidine kinase